MPFCYALIVEFDPFLNLTGELKDYCGYLETFMLHAKGQLISKANFLVLI